MNVAHLLKIDPECSISDEYRKHLNNLTPAQIQEIVDDMDQSAQEWELVGRYGNTWEDFAFGTLKTHETTQSLDSN